MPIETITNTQQYGHDIDKLLDRALESNLVLSANDIEHIRSLNQAHSQFWNRYPIEWAPAIYVVDQNDDAIANLLKAVDPYQRYGPVKYD